MQPVLLYIAFKFGRQARIFQIVHCCHIKPILLVGCLILILLSMLGVRERKYEIGVLRAMGMPKVKVAFGIIKVKATLSGVWTILTSCRVGGVSFMPFVLERISNPVLVNQHCCLWFPGLMYAGRERYPIMVKI